VRVTFTDGFDGLAGLFARRKKLAWTSSRTADGKSQIFLANASTPPCVTIGQKDLRFSIAVRLRSRPAFFPSGEKTGNPSKPSVNVTRTGSRVPQHPTRKSSKLPNPSLLAVKITNGQKDENRAPTTWPRNQ